MVNGYKHNVYFDSAIQKYNWNNIKHEILYTNLSKEEAEQKEIELIKKYKSNNNKYGYNIFDGGNVIDIEGRIKMSNNKKGKNNPMYGKKSWNNGKHWSDEVRQKLSEAKKGKKRKPLSDEAKLNIAEANKKRKGSILSIETRQKIGNARKNKKHNEETKKKIGLSQCVNVLCVETNKQFNSMKEAEEFYNCKNIYLACKGKRKTIGGYHWKYI